MKLKLPSQSYLDRMGGGHQEFYFPCPGCKSDHRVIVKWGTNSGRTEPQWSFNGDYVKPTFTPSLLVTWEFNKEEHGFVEKHVCHSFITDGKIQFLSDCTHSLKGQTVEMSEVDAHK